MDKVYNDALAGIWCAFQKQGAFTSIAVTTDVTDHLQQQSPLLFDDCLVRFITQVVQRGQGSLAEMIERRAGYRLWVSQIGRIDKVSK